MDLQLLVSDFFKAVPIGILLSLIGLGPVFFVLLETSATKGGRAAIALDLGVVFADMVFVLIAYLSSYKLLKQLTNHPALYLLGGMIMAFYGLVSIIRKPKPETLENPTEIELPKNNYLNLFFKGFFLNFINIGVLAFWLALIVLFSPQLNMNPVRIFVFFGAILFSYFLVDLGKILLAKQLKNKLTSKHIMWIRKGIGLIILIGGLYVIYEGVTGNQHINDTIRTIRSIDKKDL